MYKFRSSFLFALSEVEFFTSKGTRINFSYISYTSPMEIRVFISGVMLLVHLKIALITHLTIVLALQHQELDHKCLLLAEITIVNQETLEKLGILMFTKVTHSGMLNSVNSKEPAAMVSSLPGPHGSVYSCPPIQLIGLRCGFAVMKVLAMKISLLNN